MRSMTIEYNAKEDYDLMTFIEKTKLNTKGKQLNYTIETRLLNNRTYTITQLMDALYDNENNKQ